MVPVPTNSKSTKSFDKQALRKQILATRQLLGAGEVEQRSQRVFKNFLSHIDTLLAPDYSSVALYFPIRGEVDTRPFYKYFKARKRRCLFPKMSSPVQSAPLEFFEVGDWAELSLGALGIGEPRPNLGAVSVRPDVVIVPGIAFSHDAHRVGFGAGYYDRTIEEWGLSGQRELTRLVGIAYDFQLLPQLPSEPHDQVLDYVVAEESIFKKGSAA